MCVKCVAIMLCCTGALALAASNTIPAPAPKSSDTFSPQVITIEHFESLLRRAGDIFNPARFRLMDTAASTAASPPAQFPIPYRQLQPPTEQPFNFYLPVFANDNDAKLDEKSRKLEKFSPPPPKPAHQQHQQTNYYAEKPKKIPKKFSGDSKQINLKWLNTFEKEALAGPDGGIPRAVYMADDDRSRINFDDSFFVDSYHVKAPADNEPHKDRGAIDEADEEDLVAVPALQIPLISYSYDSQRRS